MRYVGFWHGGSSYAVPDPARDLETFTSLADARDTLWRRTQNFDRRTPCVSDETPDDGGPEIHLYRGEYTENGPDYILSYGPRGGIRTERT